MTALAQIPLRMDLRRILCHRFMDRGDRLQHFIIDLDQLLCLVQDLPRLRDDQTDGIADTAGDAALCDHHIPVLLQMSHLIVGNIIRCQHIQYPRKRQRFLTMDVDHSGTRIL